MSRYFYSVLKTLIMMIMILNLINIKVIANPMQEVENRLSNIGVKEAYIETILNHLERLKLTEDDVVKINENLAYVLENTKGKTKVTDCTLSQLYNLYSKGMEIAKGFDLKLSMNFFSNELSIKNSNGNILFASDFKEMEKLYKKYLILGYNKEEDIQYLVDSFRL